MIADLAFFSLRFVFPMQTKENEHVNTKAFVIGEVVHCQTEV